MTNELPESGMATGNDESGPGGASTKGPLNQEEQAVLVELRRSAQHVTKAVEDTPEAQAAVADYAPLQREGPS
jgi:hypothetical protein